MKIGNNNWALFNVIHSFTRKCHLVSARKLKLISVIIFHCMSLIQQLNKMFI